MMLRTGRRASFRLSLLAGTALLGSALGAAIAQESAEVLAKVNGAPITKRALDLAEAEVGQAMGSLPQGAKQDYLTSFLVDMKVLAMAAEKQGVAKDPGFEQRLSYLRDKALMEELLDREISKTVNDAAVKAFYDQEITKAPKEQEVRARHILVPTEEEAKTIAADIAKGGDFAAIAKEKTQDPSGKETGGDLGFFSKDQMVPEFAEAAFALESGKVSAPLKTQFGWHVIKVEEKRERPVPTLAEVEDRIRAYLTRKAQGDLVTKLRAEANIERTTPPAAAPPAPAGGSAAPAPPKP